MSPNYITLRIAPRKPDNEYSEILLRVPLETPNYSNVRCGVKENGILGIQEANRGPECPKMPIEISCTVRTGALDDLNMSGRAYIVDLSLGRSPNLVHFRSNGVVPKPEHPQSVTGKDKLQGLILYWFSQASLRLIATV